MKIYYKVIHLFFTRQADHIHCFEIGIYDSKKKALDAIDALIHGGDMKQTYEAFIKPVFIMNAVEEAMETGKTVEVKSYE